MNKLKKLTWVILFFYLILDIGFIEITNAEKNKLSQQSYSDPKEFFKIIPPPGWQIQQYPDDPRGKVTFIGADGVDLRVLAKGVDFNSFEELLEAIKDIENRIGINTNIQKITFQGRPAVKIQLHWSKFLS